MNKELLLERFEESGLNYNELANEINISRNTIHNVIVGHTCPSYHVLTGIADVLKLTQDDIINIFFPNLDFLQEVSHDKLA